MPFDVSIVLVSKPIPSSFIVIFIVSSCFSSVKNTFFACAWRNVLFNNSCTMRKIAISLYTSFKRASFTPISKPFKLKCTVVWCDWLMLSFSLLLVICRWPLVWRILHSAVCGFQVEKTRNNFKNNSSSILLVTTTTTSLLPNFLTAGVTTRLSVNMACFANIISYSSVLNTMWGKKY